MSSPARTARPIRNRTLASVLAIVALIASVLVAPSAAFADPTSSMSGVVYDANGPVAGVQVTLFDGYNQGPTVSSDTNGVYLFEGLEPGTDYRLDFSDALPVVGTPHVRSYWPGVPDFESAPTIELLPDEALDTLDITLDIAPSLSGTVTGPDGPLEGVSIYAYPDTDPFNPRESVTDASGAYQIVMQVAANYTVRFVPPAGYLSEWYDDVATQDDAQVIPLAVGDAVVADATIAADVPVTGTIAGKVTGPGSVAVEDATVSVYDVSDTWITSVTTNSSGNYVTPALAAGSYYLEITGPAGGDYITEWYNNKTSFATATAIAVAAGSAITGKNVLLATSASISGTVTDSAGNLAGVDVVAETLDGTWAGEAVTDASGAYKISGLGAGTYTLQFRGVAPTYDYMTQWWNGATSLGAATPITVTAGQAVTGKNALLVKGTSISGKVTGAGGAALQDASVYVYDASYDYVSSAFTDGSGNYRISDLPPGSYRLQFNGPWEAGYITEWYNNKSSFYEATVLPLAAGAQLTGKNVALIKGASISGKVTSSSGNVNGASVTAYATNGGWAGNAYTDASGNYKITSLPAGTYTLEFSGGSSENNLITEYWSDKPDREDANTITLTTGQAVTGKNAVMTKGAKISGTVKNAAGAALSNVMVRVYNATSSSTSYTDSAGKYTVAGLRAGTYKVVYELYESGQQPVYYYEYWNNKYLESAATGIALVTGQSFAANVVLDKRPTITGKVTNASGAALSGVVVTARSATGQEFKVTTSSSGVYTVKGLEAGKYTLEFDSPGNHITEWYNNKTSLAASTPVTLTTSQALTGINAALATGATISGTIRGASNALLTGAVVTAYTPTGDVAGTATTTSTGKYTINGLPAGSYKVRFSASSYIPIWWASKTTLATSTAIPVSTAQAVVGKDVVLSKGGSISGNVKGSGANLAGVYVTAYNSFGDFAGYTQTNSSGNYTFTGLYPGQFTLQFRDSGGLFYEQWYSGKSSQATATKVTVSAGVATTGRNVVLIEGGTISGTITLAGSTPTNATGATVTAYDTAGRIAASTTTDSSGDYALEGLKAGTYKLEVRAPWDATSYSDQWYLNKTSFATANSVTVAAGATVTGKNVALAKYNPGSISGNVKGGSTNLVGYWVYAYKAGSEESVASDDTDASGNYKITDLEPGTYKLYFSRPYDDETWIGEWFSDKATFAAATTITVSAGQAVTAKNAVLGTSSSVSGNIKGGSPATNLAGVQVFAYSTNHDGYAWAVTDASGNYKIVGLDPGTYTLSAEYSKSAYAETWWGGKYTQSEATTFTVGTAAAVTGKNVVMAKAATISGSLSATTGQKLDGIQVLAYRKTSAGYEPYPVHYANSSTNGLGAYSVPGLAPGSYALQFLDNATGNSYGADAGLQYNTEYWQDKSTLATATAITVSAGQVLTGKNGVLLKK